MRAHARKGGISHSLQLVHPYKRTTQSGSRSILPYISHGVPTSDILGTKWLLYHHPSRSKHTLSPSFQSPSSCQSLQEQRHTDTVSKTGDCVESGPPIPQHLSHFHDGHQWCKRATAHTDQCLVTGFFGVTPLPNRS